MTVLIALGFGGVWVAMSLWFAHRSPASPDLASFQRNRDARDALDRISTRHSVTTFSAAVPAARCYGASRRVAAADPSSGYLVLASEGRPAALTSIPAKADRPTLPRMAMASRDAAGTFSTGHPVT